MGYVPLKIDVSRWPHVEQFIRHILEDLYFQDVHAMLRLPIKAAGVVSGCNFAITHVLLAAVAGISSSLYAPRKVEPFGGAFIEALVDFYPWKSEKEAPKTKDARRMLVKETLYEEFRGPLVHHIGLPIRKRKNRVQIIEPGYVLKIKRLTMSNGDGLSEEAIEGLESSDVWPFQEFQQTLVVQSKQGKITAKVLKLERFYWGVRRMVAALSKDASRMGTAEAFLNDRAKEEAT